MTNQGLEQGRQESITDKFLTVLAWGAKGKLSRAAVAAVLAGLPTVPAGNYLTRETMQLVGYSEEAHRDLKARYDRLVEEKRRRGIPEGEGPLSWGGWKHWAERMHKEFGWSLEGLQEWAGQSEPALKKKLQAMDGLKRNQTYINIGLAALSFLFFFTIGSAAVGRTVHGQRPRLLEKELAAQGQSVAGLRSHLASLDSESQQRLRMIATVVDALMTKAGDDVSKLSPNEIEVLRLSLLSAVRMIVSSDQRKS